MIETTIDILISYFMKWVSVWLEDWKLCIRRDQILNLTKISSCMYFTYICFAKEALHF